MEELRGYCYLVASVVGRMCVRIFGFTDPVALERADDLGLALQLTNILRDVTEDAVAWVASTCRRTSSHASASKKQRFAARYGRSALERTSSPLRRAARTQYFVTGYEVLDYIPRRPAACVRTMAGIYEGILKKIARDPGCRCISAPRSRKPKSCASW